MQLTFHVAYMYCLLMQRARNRTFGPLDINHRRWRPLYANLVKENKTVVPWSNCVWHAGRASVLLELLPFVRMIEKQRDKTYANRRIAFQLKAWRLPPLHNITLKVLHQNVKREAVELVKRQVLKIAKFDPVLASHVRSITLVVVSPEKNYKIQVANGAAILRPLSELDSRTTR